MIKKYEKVINEIRSFNLNCKCCSSNYKRIKIVISNFKWIYFDHIEQTLIFRSKTDKNYLLYLNKFEEITFEFLENNEFILEFNR